MCDSDITKAADVLTLGATGFTAARAGSEAAVESITPDIPELPKAPDAPPRSIDPKVQGQRARERDRARASAGLSSTILTGSGGLTASPSSAPKTLLGS